MAKATVPSPRRGRRIMRQNEVAYELGICRTTLYKWIKAGRFPKPRRYGPNVIGWPEAVVDEWMDSRPDAEDAA